MGVTVKRYTEFWDFFHKFYDFDVKLDDESSERAGYKIYRDPENFNNWISDLGNRIEINTADGKSYMVWVEHEQETEDVADGGPTNVYQKVLGEMTPEKLAELNVQLCYINNNKLFWVTSYGQLYNYDKRDVAVQEEYKHLCTKLGDSNDFT